jgi:anti-sigma factor RsiW
MGHEDLERMKCQELFARLSEFVDGELPEGICSEIEAHLSGCEPCEAFLRTLRKTVEICQQLPPDPLSDETKRELREILWTELDSLKHGPPLDSSTG